MCESVFIHVLPDAQTRAAIHAPTSKDWEEITDFPFGQGNAFSEQLLSCGVDGELD